MKKNFKKGFTLIELLVVVAIIGILASVVLASLNTARAKGVDAKITSEMSSMRAQALLYTQAGSAVGTASSCAPTISSIFDATATNYGLGNLLTDIDTTAGLANVACGSTANNAGDPGSGTWVVAAKLTSGSAGYYCVDSTGVSRNKTSGGTAYAALIGAAAANPAIITSATACN
jgi:type IV pilus assembly protein PilA